MLNFRNRMAHKGIWYLIIYMIMTTQSTMICRRDAHRKIFKIPPQMDCEKSDYERWTVRIARENNDMFISNIKTLRIIARECKTYMTLVGGKISEKTERNVEIPFERARQLMNQHACLNSEGNVIHHPVKNGYQCDFSYMKHKTFTTYSCYIDEGKVGKSRTSTMRSGLMNLDECEYEKGWCKTSRNEYAIWDVINKVKLNYISLGNFNATKLGTHLIIPKLAMTLQLKNNDTIKVNENLHVNDLRITRLANEVIQSDSLIIKSGTSEDAIKELKEDIDRKFQYVFDVLASPIAEEKFNCRELSLIMQLERQMAKTNPTEYVRSKLKVRELIAENKGEFLIIYPCKSVSKVEINNNYSIKDCYMEQPIKYKIDEKDVFNEGFLTATGEIITESIRIPCSNQERYLEMNGKLIKLSKNVSIEINENDVNEFQGEIREGIPFPDDYPRDAWTHNETIFDQSDGIKKWIKYVEEAQTYKTEEMKEKHIWREIKEIWNYMMVGIVIMFILYVITRIVMKLKGREIQTSPIIRFIKVRRNDQDMDTAGI